MNRRQFLANTAKAAAAIAAVPLAASVAGRQAAVEAGEKPQVGFISVDDIADFPAESYIWINGEVTHVTDFRTFGFTVQRGA